MKESKKLRKQYVNNDYPHVMLRFEDGHEIQIPKGVGKALLAQLIARSTALGYRQMIAVIGDSANAASIGVHASLGFHHTGVLRASGIKFGRWLDVVYMQRALGRGVADIPA